MADSKLSTYVAFIVAAYVSSNLVASQDVPHLIKAIYESLTGLGSTAAVEKTPTPAMTIRVSVKPDSIGCLECGQRFKTLRKHLASHDLTADEYRGKWSLPASYAMISAEYSARRSGMAKASGLGKHR